MINDKDNRKKIGFFKMGTFPLAPESHISNKILNVKRLHPVVLCKKIDDTPNNSYLKKFGKRKDIRIYASNNPDTSENIKKDNIDNPKSHNFAYIILRDCFHFMKKLPSTIFSSLMEINWLKKLLHYNHMNAPEFIVKIYLHVFRKKQESSFRRNKGKAYFFAKTIREEKLKVINGVYGWEVIPLSIIRDNMDKKDRFKIILSIRGRDLAIIKRYACIRDITKKNADLMLTRSAFMRNELISIGFDADKILVNHSGCDFDKFSKVKNNYSEKKIKMLIVGRLVEKKGHIYLLEACKILKKKNIDFELTILGEGPLRKKIERFISENDLDKNIRLVGQVQNNEIPEYFRKNKFFVLPSIVANNSDAEGIPVSLMEAMASGLICISTKCVGIPELIDDSVNGYLVKERNSEDIAEKIISVSKNSNKENNQIRESAIAKVKKEFNSKVQSRRFENIVKRRFQL